MSNENIKREVLEKIHFESKGISLSVRKLYEHIPDKLKKDKDMELVDEYIENVLDSLIDLRGDLDDLMSDYDDDDEWDDDL